MSGAQAERNPGQDCHVESQRYIRRVLDLLFEPGFVIEVRCLKTRWGTVSGFFNDFDELAAITAQLSGTVSAVYVTLNPVNPDLLARANNRIERYATRTTGDADIVNRRWLPIDFDPVRPAGISSTDTEKAFAMQQAEECRAWLEGLGFPNPIFADSGNGAHLAYRIELPNDDASKALLQQCLQALAARFTDDKVAVDVNNFNAARIWKLYGTLACKGDNMPDRPHRMAKVIEGRNLGLVSFELLQKLVSFAPEVEPQQRQNNGYSPLSVDEFVSLHGIKVKFQKAVAYGRLLILEICPFNPDHNHGEAHITVFSSGARAFACKHNSCAFKKWQDLRELYEPGYRDQPNQSTRNRKPDAGPEGAHFVDWPEPGSIQAPLYPIPAFDPDVLLPEPLRAWIMDEAERMPCPPDFIAAPAIVIAGSIIGARCAVKPKAKDDWLIIPNIWGGNVGLPSAKKSPAAGSAMKPLDKLIAQAIEKHSNEMKEFEAQNVMFAAEKEALEHNIKAKVRAKYSDPRSSNGSNSSTVEGLVAELRQLQEQAPLRPIQRRYKTNDTTVEKLGELLRDNPNGLLVQRDELMGLLSSWEREDRQGDRAFFLEAWNGTDSFDTDRIGRGSICIPNLCVSIFGGIQPDKLTIYLEQAAHSLANDGMLQRFQILVYPDHIPWDWCDRFPAKTARDRAFEVFNALADFEPTQWGATPADDFVKFSYFQFDAAAQKTFIEWSAELHNNRIQAEDNPLIIQHLAKYDKLFPALALIFHLIDCTHTERRGAITESAAIRAAAWCDYLEQHARRCYGLLLDDGLRSAQALAVKVKASKLSENFKARDVKRNQWRYLTTDESVQVALDWLIDEGWLRPKGIGGSGPGSGRRTVQYLINPKLKGES